MRRDPATRLSVSRAAMSAPRVRVSDVRVECEDAIVPPLPVGDDLPPDEVGVPMGEIA
jgi:hypothetical protein